MSNSPWHLAVQVPGGDGAHWGLQILRSLGSDEYVAFKDASDRIIECSGQEVLGGLIGATKALQDGLGQPKGFPLPNRSGPVLTSWLAEITSSRARVGALASKYFGARDLEHVQRSFASAHQADRDYRLAWELRNLDQHHGNPSTYLRVNVGLEGRPAWELDLDRLFEDHRQDKGLIACSKLWDGTHSVDFLAVIRSVRERVERIFAELICSREGEIRQSLYVVVDLWSEAIEAVGPPCAPVVLQITNWPKDANPDSGPLSFQLCQVTTQRIGELVVTLDRSLTMLGRTPPPPKDSLRVVLGSGAR